VQLDFARPLFDPRDLIAVGIDDAEVFRLHVAFGDARRSAEEAILGDPDADVAVVGGRETAVVQPTAHFADQFPFVAVVEHHVIGLPSVRWQEFDRV
jgi:hypothetical protein